MLAELKIELLKLGHSQDWLARRLGKSATWVSRRMRGRIRLRASERRQIAEILQLPPSKVFMRRRFRKRLVRREQSPSDSKFR
jgi:transcriptional regulator with XRE-family HTH domain